MNSPMRLSMKSSLPSTRTTPEPLRRARWSSSSNNSSEETEQFTLISFASLQLMGIP